MITFNENKNFNIVLVKNLIADGSLSKQLGITCQEGSNECHVCQCPTRVTQHATYLKKCISFFANDIFLYHLIKHLTTMVPHLFIPLLQQSFFFFGSKANKLLPRLDAHKLEKFIKDKSCNQNDRIASLGKIRYI